MNSFSFSFREQLITWGVIALGLALLASLVFFSERGRCRAGLAVARTSTDSTLVMTRGACWLWRRP